MCRLLLSMLTRPENDPLKHPEVAKHVPEAVQGMSMLDWVDGGWRFTDANWPFGRSEYRHDGATYVLGPAREVVKELIGPVIKTTLMEIAFTTSRSRPRQPKRYIPKNTYADGLKKGKEAATKYPISCDLEISILSSSHPEFPGLVFATLVGFGNRPGGDPQVLSHFRLRVAHPKMDENPNTWRYLSYGRLLDKNWIDLSIIKQWLAHCEQEHGNHCKEHDWGIVMQRPQFLRVIDVDALCLVQPQDPMNCRFLALSYVWGGANTIKLTYRNQAAMMWSQGLRELFDDLPRTIVDAMEIVKALGEKYLWVDSLCIMQEDTTEAREQIATMDRVYGSALLTIVAAQGDNANSGLRGVQRNEFHTQTPSLPRDIRQSSAEMKDGAHIIAPFDSTQHLSWTSWNSRAWTFQEKLMSKRLLVFAGDEVVWYCRKMTCREDMRAEDSGYITEPLESLSLKPQYFGIDVDKLWVDGSLEVDRHGRTRIVRSGTFAAYAKAIESYTSRQSTYKSDAIRALHGLLHVFQLSFKSEFIAGLPNCIIDIALLWRPTQQLKRREGFPSWSWAGWEGQVTYNKPMKIERDDAGHLKSANKAEFGEEGIQPLLRWHIYSESPSHSQLHRVNGHGWGIPLQGDPPMEWEASPYFAGYHNDRTVLNKQLHLSDLMYSQRQYLLKSKVPHLVFVTSCVDTFQLGDSIRQHSDLEMEILNSNAPSTSTGVRARRFSITDTEMQWTGSVLLDGEGPEWIYRGQHAFILISEAQWFGLDQEKVDIGEFPNYSIMLVEHNRETGVSTRLGLGRVKKTAWMMANSVLKTIVLG
ncbi:HET-domain-containing protein [Penicillium malachiteum]|uniref:HET-domain-containing protein n=1 Tax=Penicillium malachiteum TaxID=1324776 RepID=A0AAD6HU28_9EURO|nr:HET-domain-containing protein [Penicillium malachiteum]